jgi:hypothetical protein
MYGVGHDIIEVCKMSKEYFTLELKPKPTPFVAFLEFCRWAISIVCRLKHLTFAQVSMKKLDIIQYLFLQKNFHKPLSRVCFNLDTPK